MARVVITKAGIIPGSGYGQPARPHKVGDVVELSASEQTAFTSAGLTFRTATVVTIHDQLGEATSVSNGS